MSDCAAGARAIVGVLCVAGMGCAPTAPPPPEPPLRLLVRSPVATLDPQLADDFTTSGLLGSIYEPLVELDDGLRPRPALAETWGTPTDSWWRFKLREGVRLHDGQVLTAARVVERLRTSRSGPGSRDAWKLLHVERFEASRPRYVEVLTRGPAPLLLAGLSQVLITGGKPEAAASAVGTGPYRVAAWDGARLSLRAFAGYRGTRPDFDAVEVWPLADGRARVAEVLAGRADIAEFPPPDTLAGARANPHAQVIAQPGLVLSLLGFRVAGTGAFADPIVRRAVAGLIDRERLVREAVAGFGRPAWQLAPRAAVGYFAAVRAPDLAPDAARAALRSLRPGGLRETLYHVDRDRGLALQLKQLLAGAGFELETVELTWPELDARLQRGEAPAWLMQFTFTSGDVADLLNDGLHSPTADGRFGSVNFSGLADPQLDALVEAAGAEMDHGLRLGLLERAVRRAMDSLAVVPLFEADTLYVTSRRVRLALDPSGKLRPHNVRRAPPAG
ncbi:MAG: ABC transporter substrate-binding protein [Vicinamibacteria bacterium]|nr:ABC transporter substrate-binding protein [Vicinamibacteria bacterium]